MVSRPTARLLVILSLITFLVMTAFVVVRFNAASDLMQSNLQERSQSVAERVANSVRPTIWNVYKKVYDRNYSAELASAILDSEMSSPFVEGIKVFGNFGHLYMGRIKVEGEIVQFDNSQHSRLWMGQKNRIRFPIKVGQISIGNVEVSYSDKNFTENLYRNLVVESAQVAVVSFLFVGSLFLILRFALLSPIQSLQVAQQALDSLNEAVFVTDANGRIMDVNPAYTSITQFKEEDILGLQPDLYPEDVESKGFRSMIEEGFLDQGRWSGEVIGRKRDGSIFPGWLNLNRVERKDNTVTFVGVLTDIAEKKEAEEKLHNLAFYDSLTEMPNRHSFMIRLEEEIALAHRENSRVGLLYLDLDNFKWANDQFGHAVGDKLLISVAARFKRRLRESDLLYRIGGDEFTVIVNQYEDESALVSIANELVNQATDEFVIEGNVIKPGASVGISTFPSDSDNAKDLIIQADTAMYQAKEAGRGQVRFFSSELEQERQKQQKVELLLKEAISRNELLLYFQPKAHIVDGHYQFESAEALVRWFEGDQVVYYPDQFIDVAEKSNLICELGYWVIHQVCQQLSEWKLQGLNQLKVAINLSPRQLRDEKLFDYLLEQMTRFDIDPADLELEITEYAVIEDIDNSIKTLRKLKTLGVSIAMDDFGTGYSSLSYLKQLPIDVLKIDRSFISTLPFEQGDVAIVTAIFSMASALNLQVVAEGVETQEQLDFLIKQKCHMAQGYLFAPALAPEDFIDWLRQQA
ncbi:EAL domain-containing protein [Neptuniibacter sp.]|uniref:putative bifunctional diguanylate cyclase/phosphodiesterase n=1 Tax=Neptuniibacter sp. TaxID=1962643 RepID=UPI0026335921|nr:EAL domain-containing protein [Neptuniibacter sp.]MCP4596602.1 EAL domain-containing protein [Neptuniibacter sp.]